MTDMIVLELPVNHQPVWYVRINLNRRVTESYVTLPLKLSYQVMNVLLYAVHNGYLV